MVNSLMRNIHKLESFNIDWWNSSPNTQKWLDGTFNREKISEFCQEAIIV